MIFKDIIEEITMRKHIKKIKGGKKKVHMKPIDSGLTDEGPTGLTTGTTPVKKK